MLSTLVLATLLQPVFTTVPPPLDGRADAPAWRRGARVIGATTDVYVLEDHRYLYVVFAARTALPRSQDDTVSVSARNGAARYTFAASPLGPHWARSSLSARYDPAWASEGCIVRGGYQVTLQIPRAAVRGFSPSAWRGPFVPNIPNAQHGIEVRSAAANVTFDAVDVPQAGGRDDLAQGMTYAFGGGRFFASLQRVQSSQPGSSYTAQSVSVGYGTPSLSVAAGYERAPGPQAARSALAFLDAKIGSAKSWLEGTWSDAGPSFSEPDGPAIAAGSHGYGFSAARALGEITLAVHADRYATADAALAQADRSLSASWSLPDRFGTLTLARSETRTPLGRTNAVEAGFARTIESWGRLSASYGCSGTTPAYSFSFTPQALVPPSPK